MKVSVVMPTYRRPALMQRCLDALLAQTLAPECFEILVVDDSGEDSVRALVLARAAQRAHPRIRYLRPRGSRGPAAARNRGWREADAPLVAFTDDDTIPEPGWLAAGVEALQRHPRWVAAAGQVVVPLPADRRPTDHERMTLGLQHAEFVTANAFVRKGALALVGGFDERFRRAWREDSDLQFRLQREAGPVGRCDEARVVHPVREAQWGISLDQQRNTFFDALLYKKHPRLYRERIRRVPPWDYYAIVLATLAAPALWLAGSAGGALTALAIAVALVLHFAWRRLGDADHSAAHVAEMLATSALIPYLSVWWRVRGALHFRAAFL
jgi:GT2 family glycosyltransferase